MSRPFAARRHLECAPGLFDEPQIDIAAILELALIELIALGDVTRDQAIIAVEEAATTLQSHIPHSERVALAVVINSLAAAAVDR